MNINPTTIASLSDTQLLVQVGSAVQDERHATARLIALLMELDTRRLYLGEGFSSLFTYCTQALHLSEHAAYARIEAARATRRFPIVLEFFAAGAVTLTAIRLLAPHLTLEHHQDVLQRAQHKSKRDIELLVAHLSPKPDVRPMIRRLPNRRSGDANANAKHEQKAPDVSVSDISAVSGPSVKQSIRARPAEVKPLAPERYQVQFTVSRETYEKLRRAQDLLRHAVPDGDPSTIFERALTLLVAQLEKTKAAATDRPHVAASCRTTSRHIPAAVRRTVWQRDGGRCAFQGSEGRCTETAFLEFHHVAPFAAGGHSSVDNIELRCRAHNQYEADCYFGTPKGFLFREARIMFGLSASSFRNESTDGPHARAF
jgi:hypothetical protein